MYQFIDKHNLGKPYTYIHPYKQFLVKNIVDKIFDGVEYLVVFGSATSMACKPYSDLDICVVGDFCESELAKLRVKGESIDILHYCNLEALKEDRRLYNEIAEKGVKVYG